jgi:hypothetical protein
MPRRGWFAGANLGGKGIYSDFRAKAVHEELAVFVQMLICNNWRDFKQGITGRGGLKPPLS